jgi:diguanylate cyclase (GGDEF)-like protein
VTRRQSSNDDATGRQLWLLIGLVVVLASVAVAWSAVTAGPMPSWLLLAGLVLSIAVANRTVIWMRIRSNRLGLSWTEVALMAGFVLVPVPWVILCTVVATGVSKLSSRLPAQKRLFAIAKEALVAAVAGAIFLLAGASVDGSAPPRVRLLTVAVATIAMWLVDEGLTLAVIALATRSRVDQMLRTNWELRATALVARYVVSVLVMSLLVFNRDARVLAIVPPVILCLHLWHAGRLRSREERKSWQRLAQTTDELNVVDLASVLHSAIEHASQLFSVDEAEIELHDGDGRTVRGAGGTVTYDGAPDPAERPGVIVPARLAGHDGSNPIGELRLRFRSTVRLTESEKYKLRTFASALYTAVRNARAYAELERISADNAHAAMHDPLTGLANRRKLFETAGDLFENRADDGIVALLLIDLNHFKEINDTLGHSAGDRVLCEVACRLQYVAQPDELVARLGGDEFALLFSRLPSPAMASHRAQIVLSALDEVIEVDGMQLTVEGAGGIALAPGTGGVQELVRRADVAMYQAKRSGNRTAVYVHSRDTADLTRLTIGSEVKRAVEREEFVVDFQPIVDLGTGEVVSAEALTQWHHTGPNHPAVLETVERSGQLAAFADAMLEQSLSAIGIWREAGFDVPVAVNVSPRSLLDPDFPEAVLTRLEHHHIPADRLVLELAETLTISQIDVVARTLTELRDAGVRLTLDNFGTGVSSLSVLSRIPVHQLKIDREFVAGVETSSEAAAVIRSTVDLARSLHLSVVAEGVESEPQRHALWELGCVAGQGHLFARPMRAGRMLATLRRGTGGRPGTLAGALHESGSVVRMPRRRSTGNGRSSLPHLPA